MNEQQAQALRDPITTADDYERMLTLRRRVEVQPDGAILIVILAVDR